MKKRMLADVLWDAANDHLRHEHASCCAVFAAEHGSSWHDFDGVWPTVSRRSKALKFVRSLGCRTCDSNAFSAFPSGEARQGARYMWLLLAMHVAEDEGVTL